MINNIQIHRVASLDEIAPLRSQYLDELFQPQELYVELKVRKSAVYRLNLSRTCRSAMF